MESGDMENNSGGKVQGVIQGNSELQRHDSGGDKQLTLTRGYSAEGRKDTTTRPCAVIGPESVGHSYTRKDDLSRSWNSGGGPPYYQHSYYPPRNISPRQSFQENMSRIVVPSPSEVKNYQEVGDTSKSSSSGNSKYCEGAILVKPPHMEMSRPPYYPPPPVDYQRYPEYATPRIQVIKGAQMFPKVPEQTPYIFPPTPSYPCKAYTRVNNVRYEPYPHIKDKYVQQTRYIPVSEHEYTYQYPGHVSPLSAIEKFNEVKKRLAHTSEYPLRYFPAPHNIDYHPKVSTSVPARSSQHSTATPYPEVAPGPQIDPYGTTQPKVYGYNVPDKTSQYNQTSRSLQDARSKQNYYPQYGNVPYQDSLYNSSYGKVPTSAHAINYTPVNVSYATANVPSYQKSVDMPYNDRTIDYDPAYYRYYQKHAQQPAIAYNPLDHVPTQFSPNIISPAESNTSCNSVTTLLPQSLEDGGYVSQCSTSSGRSSDPNATHVKDNFLEPRAKTKSEKNPNNGSKSDKSASAKESKNSPIDLRQYYSTWVEEYEETPRSQETPNSLENVPTSESSSAVDVHNIASVPPHNVYPTDKAKVPAYPADKSKVPNSQHIVYSTDNVNVLVPPHGVYSTAKTNVPVSPYTVYSTSKANVSVSRAVYSAERSNMSVSPYGMYSSNKSILPAHRESMYSTESANVFTPQRIVYSTERTQVPSSHHGVYSTAKINVPVPQYSSYSTEKPTVPVHPQSVRVEGNATTPVPQQSEYSTDKANVPVPPRRSYSIDKNNVPVSAYSPYSTVKANVSVPPHGVYSAEKSNVPVPPHSVYSAEKTNVPVPPRSIYSAEKSNLSALPHSIYSTEKIHVPLHPNSAYSAEKTDVPVSAYNAYNRQKSIVPVSVHSSHSAEKGNAYIQDYYRYNNIPNNNGTSKVSNSDSVHDYNARNSRSDKSVVNYVNKSASVNRTIPTVPSLPQKPITSDETSNINELIDVEAKISQSIIHKDVVFNYDIKPIEMEISIAPGYNPTCLENSVPKANVENKSSVPSQRVKPNAHEVNENNNIIFHNSADTKSYNLPKTNDTKSNATATNHSQYANQQNKVEQIAPYVVQSKKNAHAGSETSVEKVGLKPKTNIDTKDTSSENNKSNQYVRTIFTENREPSFVPQGSLYPNCLYNQPVVAAPFVNNNTYSAGVNSQNSESPVNLPNVSRPSCDRLVPNEGELIRKENSRKRKHEISAEYENYNASQQKIMREDNNAKPVHETVLKYVSTTNTILHNLVDLSNTKLRASRSENNYPENDKRLNKSEYVIKDNRNGAESERYNIGTLTTSDKYSSQFENNNIRDLLKTKSNNLLTSSIDNRNSVVSKHSNNEISPSSLTNESIETSYQSCGERLSTNCLERTKSHAEPNKGDKRNDFTSARHCNNNIIKHNIDNIILHADVANYDMHYKYADAFDSQIVATDLSMVKNYDNFEYIPKIIRPIAEVPTVDTPLRTPEIIGERLEEMGLSSIMVKTDIAKDLPKLVSDPVIDKSEHRVNTNEEIDAVFNPLQNSMESKPSTPAPLECIRSPLNSLETDSEKNPSNEGSTIIVNNLASLFDEPSVDNSSKHCDVDIPIEREDGNVCDHSVKEPVISSDSTSDIPQEIKVSEHEITAIENSTKCNTEVVDMDLEYENCENKQCDDSATGARSKQNNSNVLNSDMTEDVNDNKNDIAYIETKHDENKMNYLGNVGNENIEDCKPKCEPVEDYADSDNNHVSEQSADVIDIKCETEDVKTIEIHFVSNVSNLDTSGEKLDADNVHLTHDSYIESKFPAERDSIEASDVANLSQNADDIKEVSEVGSLSQNDDDITEISENESLSQSDDAIISEDGNLSQNDDNIVSESVSLIQNDGDIKEVSEDGSFSQNDDNISEVSEIGSFGQNDHHTKEVSEDGSFSRNDDDITEVSENGSLSQKDDNIVSEDGSLSQNDDDIKNVSEVGRFSQNDHHTKEVFEDGSLSRNNDDITELSENISLSRKDDNIVSKDGSLSQNIVDIKEVSDVGSLSQNDDNIKEVSEVGSQNDDENCSVHYEVEKELGEKETLDQTQENEDKDVLTVDDNGEKLVDCVTESVTTLENDSENQDEHDNAEELICDSVESNSDEVSQGCEADEETTGIHSEVDDAKDSVREIDSEYELIKTNESEQVLPNDESVCESNEGITGGNNEVEDEKVIVECQTPDEGFERIENDAETAMVQVGTPEDETYRVTSSTEIVEDACEPAEEKRDEYDVHKNEKQVEYNEEFDKPYENADKVLLEVRSVNENDKTISFDVENEQVIRHHIESQYHSFQLAIDSDLISADGNILYCQIESPTSVKSDGNEEERYYLQVDSLTGVSEGASISMIPCETQEVQYRTSVDDVGYIQDDTCAPWIEDVACVETVVSEEVICDEGDESQQAYSPEPLWGPNSCSQDQSMDDDLPLTPQSSVQSTLSHEDSKDPGYVALINNDPILEESQNNISENEFENLSLAMSNEDHSSSNFSEIFLKTAVNIDPPKCQYDQELINVLTGEADCDKKKEDLMNVLLGEDNSASDNTKLPETIVDQKDKEKSCDLNTYQASTPVRYVPSKTIKPRNDEDSDNSVSSKDSENISNDTYYKNDSSLSQGKLITKGAQKFIPPVKVSYQDLKCQLRLPEEKLLSLKKLNSKKNDKPTEKDIDKTTETGLKRVNSREDVVKKVKPKFDDVLKDIDETNMTWCKMKLRKYNKTKTTTSIPKMVIKKSDQGSLYTTKLEESETNKDHNPIILHIKTVTKPEHDVTEVKDVDASAANTTVKKRISRTKSVCYDLPNNKPTKTIGDRRKSICNDLILSGKSGVDQKDSTTKDNDRKKSTRYETYLGTRKNTSSNKGNFNFNKPGDKVGYRRKNAFSDVDACSSGSDVSDQLISAKSRTSNEAENTVRKISNRRKTVCVDSDLSSFKQDSRGNENGGRDFIKESRERINQRKQAYGTDLIDLIFNDVEVEKSPGRIDPRRKSAFYNSRSKTASDSEDPSTSKPQKNIVNKPIRGVISNHSSPRSENEDSKTNVIKPINKIARRRMTVSCDANECKKPFDDWMSEVKTTKRKKSGNDSIFIAEEDRDTCFNKAGSKTIQRRKSVCPNAEISIIEDVCEDSLKKSDETHRRISTSSERKGKKQDNTKNDDEPKKKSRRRLSIVRFDTEPSNSESNELSGLSDKPEVKKINFRRMTISYASPPKSDKDTTTPSGDDNSGGRTEKKTSQTRMTFNYDMEISNTTRNDSGVSKPANKISSRRKTVCEDREQDVSRTTDSDRSSRFFCVDDNSSRTGEDSISKKVAKKISGRRMTVSNDSVLFESESCQRNKSNDTPSNRKITNKRLKIPHDTHPGKSDSDKSDRSQSRDRENKISKRRLTFSHDLSSCKPTKSTREAKSPDESVSSRSSSVSSESQPLRKSSSSEQKVSKINHRRQTVSCDGNPHKSRCNASSSKDSTDNAGHKKLIHSCDPEPYIPQKVVKRSSVYEPARISRRRLTVTGDAQHRQSSDCSESSYRKAEKKRRQSVPYDLSDDSESSYHTTEKKSRHPVSYEPSGRTKDLRDADNSGKKIKHRRLTRSYDSQPHVPESSNSSQEYTPQKKISRRRVTISYDESETDPISQSEESISHGRMTVSYEKYRDKFGNKIKKRRQSLTYECRRRKRSPDTTGKRWQPYVSLRKDMIVEELIKLKKCGVSFFGDSSPNTSSLFNNDSNAIDEDDDNSLDNSALSRDNCDNNKNKDPRISASQKSDRFDL